MKYEIGKTPIQLAAKITAAFHHLPAEEQESIKRVYQKTWSLVSLHNEGLATPTPRTAHRLGDLLYAIRREGHRRGIAFFDNAKST